MHGMIEGRSSSIGSKVHLGHLLIVCLRSLQVALEVVASEGRQTVILTLVEVVVETIRIVQVLNAVQKPLVQALACYIAMGSVINDLSPSRYRRIVHEVAHDCYLFS